MAVSANRFNYLSKDTSIPLKDFTSFSDNAVYNTADLINDSVILANQAQEKALSTLQSSISDLTDMLTNNDIVDTLKDAMDSAMDAISNMELPDIVKDIFDSLKKLDFQGVKDFFKDLLHVGSQFLCNNLDFLKLFMLGYAMNHNIISGLMIALLLSWLDKYCKGFTQQEMAKSGNRSKMDMMFPAKGIQVTANGAFDQFSGYYSDFLKSTTPLQTTTALDDTSFLNNIMGGDISSSIGNLRSSEISSAQKNSYLSLLNNNIASQPVGSSQYSNLLTAKGQLMNTPLISINRRDNNIRFDNLSNNLGSYIKNLGGTTLQKASFTNLSSVEQSLYNKMSDLKLTSSNNRSLQSTPNGSFKNFNIASIMPTVSPEEEAHLRSLNTDSLDRRRNGIHPTTEVLGGIFV